MPTTTNNITPIYTFDGNVIVPGGIPENTLDITSTAFQLPGRFFSTYGEQVLQDILWTSQNFAGTNQPLPAFKGQLWYDTSTRQLRIYDPDIFGETWELVSPISSPIGLDPINSAMPQTSDLDVLQIYDTAGNLHYILRITVAGQLIGIYSKDTFQVNAAVSGESVPGLGNVYAGYNSLGINNMITANEGYFQFIDFNGNLPGVENGAISFDGNVFQFGFVGSNGILEWHTPAFMDQSIINETITVSINGYDTKDGVLTNGSNGYKFRTIGAAIVYASERMATLGLSSYVIVVEPGLYNEFNPILVPAGITIRAVTNNVTVTPINTNLDVFHLCGGSIIEGITVLNTTGAAFSTPRSMINLVTNNGQVSTNGDGYLFSYPGYTSNSLISASEQNSINTGHFSVNSTVVNGAITSIAVTNPGSGYTQPPTVTISGPGTGAQAIANISSGEVISISIIDPGMNYGSNAAAITVTLSAPSSSTGIPASAIVPIKGTTLEYLNGLSANVYFPVNGLNDGVLRTSNISGTTSGFSVTPIISTGVPFNVSGNVSINNSQTFNSFYGIINDGFMGINITSDNFSFTNGNIGISAVNCGLIDILSANISQAQLVGVSSRSGGEIHSTGIVINNSNFCFQCSGIYPVQYSSGTITNISGNKITCQTSGTPLFGTGLLCGQSYCRIISVIPLSGLYILNVDNPNNLTAGAAVEFFYASKFNGFLTTHSCQNLNIPFNLNDPYFDSSVLTNSELNGTNLGTAATITNMSLTVNVPTSIYGQTNIDGSMVMSNGSITIQNGGAGIEIAQYNPNGPYNAMNITAANWLYVNQVLVAMEPDLQNLKEYLIDNYLPVVDGQLLLPNPANVNSAAPQWGQVQSWANSNFKNLRSPPGFSRYLMITASDSVLTIPDGVYYIYVRLWGGGGGGGWGAGHNHGVWGGAGGGGGGMGECFLQVSPGQQIGVSIGGGGAGDQSVGGGGGSSSFGGVMTCGGGGGGGGGGDGTFSGVGGGVWIAPGIAGTALVTTASGATGCESYHDSASGNIGGGWNGGLAGTPASSSGNGGYGGGGGGGIGPGGFGGPGLCIVMY